MSDYETALAKDTGDCEACQSGAEKAIQERTGRHATALQAFGDIADPNVLNSLTTALVWVPDGNGVLYLHDESLKDRVESFLSDNGKPNVTVRVDTNRTVPSWEG